MFLRTFLGGALVLRPCFNYRVHRKWFALESPGSAGRVRRFPAKKTSSMRKLWRLLREWMKSGKTALHIEGLSKQDRWYVHEWCSCWKGLSSLSFHCTFVLFHADFVVCFTLVNRCVFHFFLV